MMDLDKLDDLLTKRKFMVVPDTAKGETVEEAIALQNFLNREKEKNPARIDGMIKKGSITKTKTITIKKLFEEFIEYKKTERQIKEATVLDYQGTYNMLMLFCDQYENIINLDDAFFDNLITSLSTKCLTHSNHLVILLTIHIHCDTILSKDMNVF